MSFFTSLSGMRNAQTDLAVISHNIANAETTGFKKSNTISDVLIAKLWYAYNNSFGYFWILLFCADFPLNALFYFPGTYLCSAKF